MTLSAVGSITPGLSNTVCDPGAPVLGAECTSPHSTSGSTSSSFDKCSTCALDNGPCRKKPREVLAITLAPTAIWAVARPLSRRVCVSSASSGATRRRSRSELFANISTSQSIAHLLAFGQTLVDSGNVMIRQGLTNVSQPSLELIQSGEHGLAIVLEDRRPQAWIARC